MAIETSTHDTPVNHAEDLAAELGRSVMLLASYALPSGSSSPGGEQRGRLPAWSFAVSGWPEAHASEWEPTWRPAPFAIELHCLGIGPTLDFGGEPIARTLCGKTAMVEEHARCGPRHWRGWPRCPECGARESDTTRGADR